MVDKNRLYSKDNMIQLIKVKSRSNFNEFIGYLYFCFAFTESIDYLIIKAELDCVENGRYDFHYEFPHCTNSDLKLSWPSCG